MGYIDNVRYILEYIYIYMYIYMYIIRSIERERERLKLGKNVAISPPKLVVSMLVPSRWT